MPKIEYLSSTFSKTNVRFEISTFEIGYMRNFVKIKNFEFEIFEKKCQILNQGHQNLVKTKFM